MESDGGRGEEREDGEKMRVDDLTSSPGGNREGG